MLKNSCILILNLFVFVILTSRSLTNGNHFSSIAAYSNFFIYHVAAVLFYLLLPMHKRAG